MQAASGVEDQDIKALQLCSLHRTLCNVDGLLPLHNRKRRNFCLGTKRRQLLLCGRTIDVQRSHQDFLALLGLQHLRNLGRRCCFTRALQTHHHDDRRRRYSEIKIALFRAEHFDKGIINDFDDLLAGRYRLQNLRANGLLGNLLNEVTNDGKCNVGFKQSHTHFAHRFTHVSFV